MKKRMMYVRYAAILLFLSSSTGIVFSDDLIGADAYQQALNYYNQGEYEKARKFVDKHYSKDDGEFSLLSALLFVKEDKCEEAIGAIEYVSKYFDAHRQKVDSNADVKRLYVNLKKVSVKCYLELSKWYDLEKDLRIYLDYIDKSEEEKVLALLGETYLNLVEGGINDALVNYESVVEVGSNEGIEKGVYESALYKVIGLYVFSGQEKRAVSSATRLFDVSSNDLYWLNRMQDSKWHRWVLAQPELADVFAADN